MKQKNIILIHLILWLLIVLPISCTSILLFKLYPEVIWSFYPEATMNYVLMDSLYNCITFGLSFYLFYFFVFQWLFRNENIRKGILKTIGLFLGIYILELLVIDVMYPKILMNQNFLKGAEITLFIWLLFRLGLSMGVKAIVEYFYERKRRKELEEFNFQSELSLFRAQVNPHFLFNTLNNIDALIHIDPDKASETLIQLSKQMRYLLYDSNVEKIDLSAEIKFIKNYIDLESIRLKNKNFVSFKLIGKPQGIRIAPMLFIAFIENAFKHGSNKQKDNGLEICFSIGDGRLEFKCKNTYQENMKSPQVAKHSGIGLDLVKKRLNLIYKSNYTLDIEQENSCYNIALTIPLRYLN